MRNTQCGAHSAEHSNLLPSNRNTQGPAASDLDCNTACACCDRAFRGTDILGAFMVSLCGNHLILSFSLGLEAERCCLTHVILGSCEHCGFKGTKLDMAAQMHATI